MKLIHLVCAARPNFMKVAPLYHALKKEKWCKPLIVHTGQHYDYNMSQLFFNDFDLPRPHYNLSVGSGTHAQQTANTMTAYEKLCMEERPDLIVVVGDVNSTMACAIVAKKLIIELAHLEAGLRSFDRTMPEEINRIVTDSISDILWTPSADADQNLKTEGIRKEKISRIGNIMIDTYCMLKEKITKQKVYQKYNLQPKQYVVCTFHRPENVDNANRFEAILKQLNKLDIACIFPMHLRTKKAYNSLDVKLKNTQIIGPLGYIDFMDLVQNAKYIITDSGGVQEETTYLQVPCFTMRTNTERPITITQGSNQLVNINNLIEKISAPKYGTIPKLWDGRAAYRILENLISRLGS